MVCAEAHDEEDAGWAGPVDLVVQLEVGEVWDGEGAVGCGFKTPC